VNGRVRFLEKLTQIRSFELTAVVLSFGCYFCLLAGYYLIRPVRDAMGVAGGVKNLPWLFTATLASMLLISPLFSWLTGRFTRSKLLFLCYGFLTLNLLLFYAAFSWLPSTSQIYVGRIFYVWVSVYNLFVVSLFWSFMADGYNLSHSKRLFAIIAAGGSLGAIIGSALSNFLVSHEQLTTTLLISAALLLMSLSIARRLEQLLVKSPVGSFKRSSIVQSHPWRGISLTVGSSYLRAVCAYLLCFTLSSTFLYFLKANLVSQQGSSTQDWATLFSQIDFWTNLLTFIGQFFITARLIHRFGLALALALLPALTFIGFSLLGFWPSFALLILFEALRRAVNFAVAKPCREMLFSALSQEQKYQAKNFIDTFVYRIGDAAGAWVFGGMSALSLVLSNVVWIMLPLAFIWYLLARYLGLNVPTLPAKSDNSTEAC